ncbi:MAG: DUF502 domain-containing protein [Sedimenticolaceae bacterium]
MLPVEWYFGGLGLLTGIALTLGIGLAANLFLLRRMVGLIESILERIPLVTSLYQPFKDIARLFSDDVDKPLGQVVAVDIGDMRLVGFVMQHDAQLPGDFDDDETRVAVYLAMSYQLGGFTVHVPRKRVTPLDIPADQAMRAVLTGGSLQTDRTGGRASASGP